MLGEGAFGKVYGGTCRETKKKVAIKKMIFGNKYLCKKSNYESEIIILYNIRHPGIVELLGLFNEANIVRFFLSF